MLRDEGKRLVDRAEGFALSHSREVGRQYGRLSPGGKARRRTLGSQGPWKHSFSQYEAKCKQFYDYARMDRSRLLSAENKATDILARAGIDARWVDCPASEAELDNYPDCQLPRWATDFVLKVLPKTMEDSRTIWRDSMGFSLLRRGW